MRWFRNISIQQKLTRVMVLTSVMALAVSGVAIVVQQLMMFRRAAVTDLSAVADAIAADIAPALAAHSYGEIREALRSLRNNPAVVAARVYAPDATVFAEFICPGVQNPPPLTQPEVGQWLEGGHIIVCRQVQWGNDVVATICLRGNQRQHLHQLRTSLGIVLLAMLAAAGVAVLLAGRLLRTISEPIRELAGVAQAVTERKDYSVRAAGGSQDEFGLLTTAFNQMLSGIEARDIQVRDSEAQLRQVTENIREVFWLTDAEKKQMLYISPAYEAIWGRPAGSLYREARAWIEAIHPDDRDRVLQAALTKQASGQYDEQYRIVRPDGAVRWIRDRAFPVRDSQDRVYRIAGIAEDITALKQAEQAVRLQAEITGHMAEGVVLIRMRDLTIVNTNPKFEQMFGYDPGELLGQPIIVVNAGDEAEVGETHQEILASLKTTGLWSGEVHNRRKDGTEFWCWATISGFEHAEYGQVWISVHTDITEWKGTEQKLRENEQRLRSVVTAVPVILFALDRDGVIVLEEGRAAKLLGHQPGEVVGRNVFEVFAGNSTVINNVRRALAGDEFISVVEFPNAAFETWYTTVRGADGQIEGIIGVATDITARLAAEKRYQTLVDLAVDVIFTVAPDGTFASLNPAFNRVLGWPREQWLGRGFPALVHEADLARAQSVFERTMRGEQVESLEVRVRHKDGGYRTMEIVGVPVHQGGKVVSAFAIARDVTERRRLQRQLLEVSDREQQRIGQDLHDGLCQLLAGVGFAVKALEQRLAGKSLAEARDAGEIAELVNRAIAESRNVSRGLQAVPLEAGGLSAALHELAYSVQSLYNIPCRFQCGEPLEIANNATAVHVYRIAQEAMNNAVKHSAAKEIDIALMQRNGQVMLTVTDNGIGFPNSGPEGKGMGLSIMEYRARMIGGTLQVQRGAAGGTEVSLSFQQT